VELNEKDHVVWHLLSKAYFFKGKMNQARNANEKSLSIDPDYGPALKQQSELS
jgi:hypothetical protein